MTISPNSDTSVHSGEGRWNGVAILSSVGIEEPFKGFADGGEEDPEARIVSAICAGIKVSSVYVPNGREVDHDHYRYKLSWMARLKGHLEATCQPDDLLLVGGDYNICPDDRDVWDPQNPISRTHVTKKERDALTALEQWGLAELREFYEDDGLSPGRLPGWRFSQEDGPTNRLMASQPLLKRANFV